MTGTSPSPTTTAVTAQHNRISAIFGWTLGVLACLWIAWCVAIGPLYWQDIGLAGFGWANAAYGIIAFLICFALLAALVRIGRGQRALPAFIRMPKALKQHCSSIAVSRPGRAIAAAGAWLGHGLVNITDRWWKLFLVFIIGWLWIPTTLLAAFGADIRSQIREFAWALNQWTGLKQAYIGFFSFVPMDIYPTAHYLWPDNPTYLTDQHNIVLTIVYGAVAAASRYFTQSNDPGIIVLAACQWLFAAFCCAATANRFFNLPWRRLGEGAFDFSHPECHDCWLQRDLRHPERGVIARPSRHRAGSVSRLLILLFFMFCPLAIFSTISLTKSPLFAFAFVWWFGVFYELHATHIAVEPTINDKPHRLRKRSWMALIAASCIMLISAKYAWYIILFAFVMMLLSDRKRWGVYVSALLLPALLIHGGTALAINTGVIISGDPIEGKSIQLQQIARVAKYDPDSIPQSAKDKLAPIFNLDQMAAAYFRQDADPVKSSGIQSKKVSYKWRSVTEEDLSNFNKAWLEIVKASPLVAADALFAEYFGYFNVTDLPYVSMDYYVNSDYVQKNSDMIQYYNHDWRDAVAKFAKSWGSIPVIGWVTHGNLYVTLTLLIGAAEVILRRWRALAWHLPLLVLMGVMITAPANNFERHMLPVAFVFGFLCLQFARESLAARRKRANIQSSSS